MKRLFTLFFIITIILSFSSFAQQDGDNILFGVPDISMDPTVAPSGGRSICFVPASERLDGDELANIIVCDYGYYGRVHVFKQVAKTSLQFKLVWSSPGKNPPATYQDPPFTYRNAADAPRCVAYGDLDGNGKKEIYFPIGHGPTDTVLSDTKWPRGLHVYECVGTNNYGDEPFIIRLEDIDPTTRGTINWGRTEGGGLLIADIDADGDQEIVIGTLNMAYNDDLDWSNGKAWVISLESGTFADKTAKFKTEYTYSAMAFALPDYGDGYIPCGFVLADIDADGIKEIVVAGRRIVGVGGSIGFFKATGPDTYIYGNTIPISEGPGATFDVGARMGVLERTPAEGGDIVFFNMDERNVINHRLMMLSDVVDISIADINSFTVIKQFYNLAYTGTAVGDQDHMEGDSDGFDVYFPKGLTAIYDLEYNGTGSIYDSTSYTLYEIFDTKQVYEKGLGGIVQLIVPDYDINGNGRKKLIAQCQIYRDPESPSLNPVLTDVLLNGNIPVKTRNPFFILEWGSTEIGTIEVTPIFPIMPEDYVLEQNYPNPFNPSTIIRFTLPIAEDISLIIYDINGKEVTKLIDNQRYETGTFEAIWNGKNRYGATVSSGIYFCKLKWGNFEKSMKMTLLK